MRRLGRRRFLEAGIVLWSGGVLSGCGLTRLPWEPPATVPETPLIAFVSGSSLAPASVYAAFLHGLSDLGYINGENLLIEYRDVEGKPESIPGMVSDFVGRQVALIVVAPSSVATGIRQVNERVPVVVAYGDPMANGLVDSLARPGRPTTGLTAATAVLSGKRLQLLRETVPSIARVAVLGARSGGSDQFVRETQDAALSLGLQLDAFRTSDNTELRAAFDYMRSSGDEALVVAPGTFLASAGGKAVADLAIEFRIPTMFESRINAHVGGLMGYGPDLPDLARRSATYVDKILKGANPAELPIEQPTTFDFVINLQTARTLGVSVPDSVVAQATEVIL